jgi:hypothetical protein
VTRARLVLASVAALGVTALGAVAVRAEPPISAPKPAPAGEGGDLEAALERSAPAVVSIQFLLKYEGGYETTSWSHGVVVDPDGLILLSGSEVGGGDAKLADVKVLFGADPKEWPAILVARDTTLDFAFLQIMPGEGRPFHAVDLAKAAAARTTEPKVGETLYGVTRAGRGFDYAPAVRRLYFTCRIESPRKMWDFTGDYAEAGLPVYDLDGNAVAVLTNQQSAEGADEGGGSHHDVFALPLAPVLKSLEAAKRRVPEALKKAEEARREAGKDEAGKDAPKDGPKDDPKDGPKDGPKDEHEPKDGPGSGTPK